MTNTQNNTKSGIFKSYHEGNIFGVYNSQAIPDFNASMLSPKYWQENNAITGTAQGRGTTWFIRYQGQSNENESHWVLRHYYRGGLIGKLIKDHYLFTSKHNTRAAREFELLGKMNELGLPAPKPIAYRVMKHGLVYQADLLSSRIENAQDLVDLLSHKQVTNMLFNEESWMLIGATIKRFHQHGIYHHDLNAHNILLNGDGLVYLIDFDRGEFRGTAQQGQQQSWQQNNMDRLKRSFVKEKNRIAGFQWEPKHWDMLMKGYNQQM